MIKYCCWYCKKHNEECAGCYNAAGGEVHFEWAVANVCQIKDNTCTEVFPFNKMPMTACWEVKDEADR